MTSRPRVKSSKRSKRLVINVGVCPGCRGEVDLAVGLDHGGNCGLEPLGDTTGKPTVTGRIGGTNKAATESAQTLLTRRLTPGISGGSNEQ